MVPPGQCNKNTTNYKNIRYIKIKRFGNCCLNLNVHWVMCCLRFCCMLLSFYLHFNIELLFPRNWCGACETLWGRLLSILDHADMLVSFLISYSPSWSIWEKKNFFKENQAICLDQLRANVSYCTNVNGKLLPTGSALKQIDPLGKYLEDKTSIKMQHMI